VCTQLLFVSRWTKSSTSIQLCSSGYVPFISGKWYSYKFFQIHTHYFNEHFPCKPALDGCFFDSQSPIILILSIHTRKAETLHVILDRVPPGFSQHPLYLVSSPSIDIHRLIVTVMFTSSLLIIKLTSSSYNKSLRSVFSCSVDPHIHLIMFFICLTLLHALLWRDIIIHNV